MAMTGFALQTPNREEFHICMHVKKGRSREDWGSTGQFFSGINAQNEAIRNAEQLQKRAPEGTSYSVQIYLFGLNPKNKPVKFKVWKNGHHFDYQKRHDVLQMRRNRRIYKPNNSPQAVKKEGNIAYFPAKLNLQVPRRNTVPKEENQVEEVSFDTLAKGALSEIFYDAIQTCIKDIYDPNKKAADIRKFSFGIELIPKLKGNGEVNFIAVNVVPPDPKLGKQFKIETVIHAVRQGSKYLVLENQMAQGELFPEQKIAAVGGKS
ncbi:hypothetical protein EHO57_14100 [Leptospira langatensis]|uniref:Uncharacterized protein n=1 Tax=Leptospira langatensis TaxID=2484983 RepID=A0A5R2AT25_9LEPT|nr:hypothetical protein [Leptospira langatensis]TGJ99887.1 hypothetical protein EHO57_14100 [Leptospira langatensis]